jgi:SMI1/KNR4 family protein SUKH-1
MIGWSLVFDEGYPAAGASAAELARFVATVAQPLSAVEIETINQGQRNPFPKGDPLYASWRPFDPSLWVVPARPLPPSYLEFLAWSDGGEFRTGERWFQFFPALDPGQGVRAMLLGYHLPQYMPGALPFAFNGGGVFYLFDMRQAPMRGEYPVVCARSGSLGWQPEKCIRIAESFEAACRGTTDVDDLW